MSDRLPAKSSPLRVSHSKIALVHRRAFSLQPAAIAVSADGPPANQPSSFDQEFVSTVEEPPTPEVRNTKGMEFSSASRSIEISAIRSTPPSANATQDSTFDPSESVIVSIKDIDVIEEGATVDLYVEWSDGNREWMAEEDVQQQVPDMLYAY
ncbi:hypothetical protein FGRMN_1901 [Fusarium graminum]|nr:hypothetical protein FGRMN_1901 [Fusarium graminum]